VLIHREWTHVLDLAKFTELVKLCVCHSHFFFVELSGFGFAIVRSKLCCWLCAGHFVQNR
jgi:hypothetical protein